MKRIKLQLLGITYNQIESGVYALILQEAEGTRRIPIIVGYPEAQAIECRLQGIRTQRPLTHDTMITVMDAYGISLREVMIYRMPNGVFAADLLLDGPDGERHIDSRSSDAIALAIRTGAPIFTSEEVIEEAGIETRKDANFPSGAPKIPRRAQGIGKSRVKEKLEDMSLDQLLKEMQKAADNENYELAAKLKKEIDSRQSKDTENDEE